MANLLEILFKTSAEKEYRESIKKLSTDRWEKLAGSNYRGQNFSLFEYLSEEVSRSSFKQFVFLRRIGYFLVIIGILYIVSVVVKECFSNTGPLEPMIPYLLSIAGFFCFFPQLTTSEAYLRRREITPKVLKRLNTDLEVVESSLSQIANRLEHIQKPLSIQELVELASQRDAILASLLTDEQLKKFQVLARDMWIKDLTVRQRNHEVLANCIRSEIAFLEANA